MNVTITTRQALTWGIIAALSVSVVVLWGEMSDSSDRLNTCRSESNDLMDAKTDLTLRLWSEQNAHREAVRTASYFAGYANSRMESDGVPSGGDMDLYVRAVREIGLDLRCAQEINRRVRSGEEYDREDIPSCRDHAIDDDTIPHPLGEEGEIDMGIHGPLGIPIRADIFGKKPR